MRYRALTREDVDRYMDEHTAELRKDFAANFPTGVQLSREIWTEMAVLGGA